ncbi:MAG TPA: flagellar biosynthesis anti-sigma factor FlgM [Symbiobacteriaceae bacterium]
MKVETHRLQGLAGVQAGARREKSVAKSPEGGPAAVQADQVDLSSKAQEVSALREMLRGVPATRAERVARLKALIASGRYSVRAEEIADRLLLGKVLEP